MSARGVLLTAVILALIGIGLYSLEPARPSLSGKKRRPESTSRSSSAKPRTAVKKASTGREGGSAQANAERGKAKSGQDQGQDDTEDAEAIVRYHLPYATNVGYVVEKPDPESRSIAFDMPSGTPVFAIRSGTVLGVSGPTPRPGEDMVFGRRLPRNAILIQHSDSTFALYQNVAATVDTGTAVPEKTPIATTGRSGHVKVSVSRLDEDYTWHFSTKDQPDGGYLRAGEVYLRADSDTAHPLNAVERTYATDAGNLSKSAFTRGETVRLHSRFNYPVRADTRFALRPEDSRRLSYHDARLDVGRKAAHCDIRPDDLPDTESFVAYLYFDEQPVDSVRLSIRPASP